MEFQMRHSQPICLLVALIAFAAYTNQDGSIGAAEPTEKTKTLKQRVDALENRVNQLSQLVSVLQAEQLRDVLPLHSAAIVGDWVARTDSQQVITLRMNSGGTCEITGRGETIGDVHGTGTWKLDGAKVIFLYRYDGQDELPETKLPLNVISKDSMAYAGVIYRRLVESGSTAAMRAK